MSEALGVFLFLQSLRKSENTRNAHGRTPSFKYEGARLQLLHGSCSTTDNISIGDKGKRLCRDEARWIHCIFDDYRNSQKDT